MMLYKKILALLCMIVAIAAPAGSSDAFGADGSPDVFAAAGCPDTFAAEAGFICETFPLERNGIPLHLDCVKKDGTTPAGQILLIHGATYSSHEFDLNVADPIIIELFCSSCWHHDEDSSPRGWSRDAFVEENIRLIDLERISSPTLILYGNQDPYMNLDLLGSALGSLPEGSELHKIGGGSHIMIYERPFYHEFQDRIVEFLQ